MSSAFVFPGQGSQAVGMGRGLYDAYPESRAVFDEADAALGFPLSRLCFEGPDDELQLTAHTQPALLTVSTAAARALAARGIRPSFVAGHSLGEYSALVAAGSLAFRDAVVLVHKRGRYMQEAVPVGQGAMAAILGLDRERVEAACREAAQGEVVSPANFNCPGQIAIAGAAAAVQRASEACKAAGAKRAIPLKVSAPFHCALMMPAQERLARDLEAVTILAPTVTFVNNVAAEAIGDAEGCRRGLVAQVSAAVLWEPSLRRLSSLGAQTFVEVGSGTVLAGLVKKTLPGARILGVGDPESLEAAVAALKDGAPQ
jgi:[acyl-carrier-protein] S-malonyltransferase